MKITDNMTPIKGKLTNFDHSIDEGVEEELKSAPMKKYAYYSAWNFYGEVCFDGKQFHCDIWRFTKFAQTISASSLDEIMKIASDCYGWE